MHLISTLKCFIYSFTFPVILNKSYKRTFRNVQQYAVPKPSWLQQTRSTEYKVTWQCHTEWNYGETFSETLQLSFSKWRDKSISIASIFNKTDSKRTSWWKLIRFWWWWEVRKNQILLFRLLFKFLSYYIKWV